MKDFRNHQTGRVHVKFLWLPSLIISLVLSLALTILLNIIF